MRKEEEVERILTEWRAAALEGEAPDPESVVAAHPELASELQARFAALDLLDAMLRQSRLEGAAPPERLGDYRILREVGRGGMGVVYEAEQGSMRRRVALKVLYPRITGSAKAAERFQREARAAGKLHHTNIVPVYELGRDGELWFYSMELVEGISLAELILGMRRIAMPERVSAETPPAPMTSSSLGTDPGTAEHYRHVARLFAGVAEALETAHRDGVIHRDLKPSNLILDHEGTLKVIDFGLARVLDEDSTVTASGDRLGTPAYMSPEQARKKPVDHRTDVYSLGATLYELLTLRPPYRGDAATAMTQIPIRYPRPPHRIDPRIPRDLETIVQKAMEKEAGKRYATAAEMAEDLRAFSAGDAVRARPIGPLGRSWRRVKRQKVLSGLAALVLVLAVGGGVLAWSVHREGRERAALEYRMLCARAEGALVRTGEQRSLLQLSLVDEETALDLFNRAIAVLPERPEAYLGRALALGRSPEERLGDIAAAEERGLSPRTVHLSRAHVLERLGRRDAARQELDRAAGFAGHDAADAFFEGRLLVAAKQRERGLALLTEAIRRSEEGSFHRYLALYNRAVTREEMGDLEGALEDYCALRAPGDQSPGVRLRIAALWRRIGRAEQGERLFAELLEELRERDEEDAWRVLCAACGPQEGDWREIAARSALRSRADAVPLLFELMLALRDQSRTDDQIALCRRILDLSPEQAHTWGAWAMALYRQGELDAALAKLDRMLEIDPRSLVGRQNRGAVLGELDRKEDSLAEFQRLLEIDPSYAPGLSNAALSLAELARYQEASELAERALELDREDPIAWAVRGRILARAARWQEALDVFDHAVELDPDIDLDARRGDLLVQLGRPQEALACFDAKLARDQNHFFSWTGKAGALQALGHHDESLSASTRALEIKGNYAWTHLQRARTLIDLGLPEQALASLDRAHAFWESRPLQVPTRWDLHTAADIRGAALQRLQRYAESLEAWHEALGTNPDCISAHDGLAVALINLDRDAEALEIADRMIALAPQSLRAQRLRASALLGLRRFEDALATYAEIAARAPEDGEVRYMRGGVLFRLGRFAEAAAAFEQSLEVDSDLPLDTTIGHNRLVELSIARFEIGEIESALSTLAPLLEVDSDRATTRLMAARYLAGLGRWEDSERTVKAALEKGLGSPGALALVVEILRLRGDHAQALRAAQRLYPRNRVAYGWLLAACLRATGREDEARDIAEDLSDEAPRIEALISLAYLAAVSGDAERTHAILNHAERPWYAFDAWRRARIHAVLGENDEALDWLGRAIEQGFRWPEGAAPESDFAEFEGAPRYRTLLERAGG